MWAFKVDRFTVLLVAIGGVGSVLLWARMATYGISLTDDADLYLSAAQSLLDGDGFTTWTGQPYADRAPLYPLILAILSLPYIDVIQTAEYVNAVCFGMTIFVIAMWLKSRIESRFLIVWSACACALSISLTEFSARATTEIMFILFVCCSLFAMDRFLSTERKQLLYWAAICAAGALLIRYLGVTLIGSGILILLTQRNLSWRTKLLNTLTYSCVAVTLFGVWILRNIFVIGSLLGRVHPDEFSLMHSLNTATGEISMWVYGVTGLEFLDYFVYELTGFIITDTTTVSAIVLRAAILAYTVLGVVFVLSRYRPGIIKENREILVVCLGFILVYSLYFTIHLPVSDVMLSHRYLITLFPFLLVVTAVALDGFISRPQSIRLGNPFMNIIRTRWVSILVSSIVCLWTLSWIAPNYDSIRSWNDNGKGYRSKENIESETNSYLIANPPDGAIWSTDHASLYYLLEDSESLVYRLPLDLRQTKARMFENHVVGIDNYVVWYYWRVYHVWPDYSMERLDASLGMEVVAILKDGIILKSSRIPNANLVTRNSDYYLKALLTDSHLIVESHFDVYMDYERNRLIYVRDTPCDLSDIEPEFMLNVFPVDVINLPEHRQYHEFDDLRFHFGDHAIPIIPIDRACVATISLPKYDIITIQTGQWTSDEGDIWSGEFTFTHSELRPVDAINPTCLIEAALAT